jgi:hypothetical protein
LPESAYPIIPRPTDLDVDDPPCECGESLDDGEGYDGYCGTCADIKEREGYWS